MKIKLRVNVPPAIKEQLNRIENWLSDIDSKLDTIQTKGDLNNMTLQELKAQVDKSVEVEAGAVVLIKGIAEKLAAAQNDPAAIQALSDELSASANDLAQSITANTPAE
jgi:chromosome segregation ATPase